MTVKLYEQDSLLRQCQARVLACTAQEGGYLIELDQTVLFPEGGGQLSDRGTIDQIPVTHVRIQDGHILHECAVALPIGQQVTVKLNWELRLDRMQQHCGEHIFSFCLWKLFGTHNVGFHMNEESVFIDVDKEVTAKELTQAEIMTNSIIWENRPITVQYLPAAEAILLKDKMRKFNDKLTGILRLVTVQDADVCTCCGTHPPFSGMVGMIKVIGKVKHKNGCRIEFLCGQRAWRYADANLKILTTIAQSLSTAPALIMESLKKQEQEKSELQTKLSTANKKLLHEKLLTALSSPTVLTACQFCILTYDGLDGREEKYLQDIILNYPHLLLLFLNNYGGRLRYSLLRGKEVAADCGKLLKALNPSFHGKGGGKADYAQGSTEPTTDLPSLLSQIQQQLTTLL